MILTLALALAAQKGDYEGELRERLRAAPAAVLTTSKPAYDLEICVADALTAVGTPTVLRNGPVNIVIASAMAANEDYIATVNINKVASGSELILRVAGRGWNDRLRTRIEGCL